MQLLVDDLIIPILTCYGMSSLKTNLSSIGFNRDINFSFTNLYPFLDLPFQSEYWLLLVIKILLGRSFEKFHCFAMWFECV